MEIYWFGNTVAILRLQELFGSIVSDDPSFFKQVLHEKAYHLLFMQVSGELSNDGQPMRRFMQTFVLAPGEVSTNLYCYNTVNQYIIVYLSTWRQWANMLIQNTYMLLLF